MTAYKGLARRVTGRDGWRDGDGSRVTGDGWRWPVTGDGTGDGRWKSPEQRRAVADLGIEFGGGEFPFRHRGGSWRSFPARFRGGGSRWVP